MRYAICKSVVVLALCGGAVVADAEQDLAKEREFFERRIRPVLIQHCYECHSAGSKEIEGGLQLDFREGLRKGGDSGPAVVPGRTDESLILKALRHEAFEMPPSGKLADDVIADFECWIRQGAVDPRDAPPSATDASGTVWKAQLAERARWWSLQSPIDTEPPTVADPDWSVEPVDRFIRAKLDQAGLSPATLAEPAVLLRRLSFVLTGLPPGPERVLAFAAEWERDRDAALHHLVDELLASPHFGERFARHWMDVVRYTDTYGYEWDIAAKGSWEYRDYLIRAWNHDIGFDQIMREQLAGDLLPEPRIDREAGVNESLIGPMFFHLGERRHGSSLAFNGIHQEMIDSQIDAFSKAFLGMTVGCARCHDHKLDAISQRDYYALAGVFMTPRWTSRSIDAPGRYERQIEELDRLRTEIHRKLADAWQGQLKQRPVDLPRLAAEPGAKESLEDIGYHLARLIDATTKPDGAAREQWIAAAGEWQTARQQRMAQNKKVTVLTDFSQPALPEGWVAEGTGIEHGWVADGMPLIALEGDALISAILPPGYHTHALSPKLPGAIRLPAPNRFPRPRVSLRLAGGQWAGYRDIPQNAFLNEEPKFFDPQARPTWVSWTAQPLSNGVTRVLTEISTADLNANFPPRTGVARMGSVTLPNDDDGHDKRSWFSLTGAVAHEDGGLPVDQLDSFISLYREPAPASATEVRQRLADWLEGPVNRWASGSPEAGDTALINWLLTRGALANDTTSLPEVAALVRRYREVETTIGFPRSANSMEEGGVEPVDYRLNIRGDVYREGPAVRRDFLEVFAGNHAVGASSGSGRLELAEYLSSRDHPQTARVYVNRIWQWIFGTGIVDTPSDFGKLGGRPSHPELLDWLAIRFMEEGWSTKKLVRRLVLSRTFLQGGTVTSEGARIDPDNRLRHHYATRRLEAEAIRDSLLAVSGRLDPTLYGHPIRPHRTAVDDKKRLFSGPLDGHGRRSLYLEMSIMQPPEFLVGFNLPDLKLPTGRRDVTNVPAQALILLNNPFVTAMAHHWSDRLMQDGCSDPAERLRGMFVTALGRLPTEAEMGRWLAAARDFSGGEQDLLSCRATWSSIAHALFNTKEFLYYR